MRMKLSQQLIPGIHNNVVVSRYPSTAKHGFDINTIEFVAVLAILLHSMMGSMNIFHNVRHFAESVAPSSRKLEGAGFPAIIVSWCT